MIDREFEKLLSKYEVTHWDPCKGICVIGKCEQSSTVGCCPTIHIPIVPTPTPTGNIIKSEFVTDNNKDVYYVDVAGNSILLEKVTTLTDTINGHQIGVYFNELQAPVTLNETVTSMGTVTLTGTILNIPYTDENGNTIVRSVDLSSLSGGSSGSYTSDNGLTTTGTNHQLGGNLVKHTVIDGVDAYSTTFKDLTHFTVQNFTNPNIGYQFKTSTTYGGNNWKVFDKDALSPTFNYETSINLNPSFGIILNTINNNTNNNSSVQLLENGGFLSTSNNSDKSSGLVSELTRSFLIYTSTPNVTDISDSARKEIGVTKDIHFQRNLNTLYQPCVVVTSTSSPGSEVEISKQYISSAIGNIESPILNYTGSIETGLVIFQNVSSATFIVPDPTTMINKIIEVRAAGTNSVLLSIPVYLDLTNTLNTLEPYGSNSYNNPTYIKIISDGIKWIVLNQW